MCQLGLITVTEVIGRNSELKSKAITLHFDEKLEKLYEFSTWQKSWNMFQMCEFYAKKSRL